jgi:hypothetical protein
MMTQDTVLLIEKAVQRLGQERKPILDRVVECDGGDWYLREKIVKPANDDTVRDNERALKYAYNFCRNGATVTFVHEGSGKTPDLEVKLEQQRFLVEVKKFRSQSKRASGDPVSKIVTAVTRKRVQLPDSEVGFVAVDNFDLGLESGNAEDLTHDHIVDALCELERLAAENPAGWRKPSGAIVAASTTGGVLSGPPVSIPFPHFVWMNGHGDPAAPQVLAAWLRSSLPHGILFDVPLP